MDKGNEDKMVRQIEQNLTNNINENLFLAGRGSGNSESETGDRYLPAKSAETAIEEVNPEYPLFSNGYISNSPGLTRAEYIRQAREACLRQLSAQQIYSRPYDMNYIDADSATNEQLNQKKAKVMKLFHNIPEEEQTKQQPEAIPNLGAFRSVIIRSVCAILLFLTIFFIDKYDIQLGNVTKNTIKEYVIGNDALKTLENIIVTWLK